MQQDPDFQMALLLQKQFEVEYNLEHPPNDISYQKSRKSSKNNVQSSLNSSKSLTDPSWELVDPTPNIFVLFVQFNEKFFWNKLLAVSVDWSKRMTTCAGICSYQGRRSGLCRITLSEPLLKLRPRKDLIETLLHEMIHAYLFVTHNNKDRDGHGPEFHKHMYRINNAAGTHITVYHDFHDEVRLYKQHWWRCDGPCVQRPPYFGMVRRATNRAPGAYDRWWAEHEQRCGGKFIKVKEPEKQQKSKTKPPEKPNKNSQDIRNFIPNVNSPKSLNKTANSPSPVPNKTNKPFGKQGTINKNGTVVLNPKTQTRVDKENVPATITTNNGIVGFTDLSQNSVSFPKKSKDNVPSSGNIVGFKDLAQTSGQSSSVNTFSGSGNTLTNSKMTSTQNQDYSAVRNHWINKFSNNQTSKSPELKRKSLDINSWVNKKPKSDLISSSVAGKMNPPLNKTDPKAVSTPPKGISCPNCNKSVCEDEINSHLDTCLNADVSIQSEFSSDLNESNMVECPVCQALLEPDNLNSHLDECLSGDTEEDNDEKVPNKSDKHCDNVKHCEICDNFIDTSCFDTHVQECLNSFYDDIETKYDLKNENSCNETVMCLVCNKNIVKADLDNHLEDCMVSVFDKDVDLNADEVEEDRKETVVDLNESKCYNCPICMAPIDEENMNSHIDLCLNSAAVNENIFN